MADGSVRRDSVLQIIWRGRLFLVLCALIGLGAAYGYLRFATPMYVSTSRIVVEKPNAQSRFDGPQPAGSTSSNYLQTQAGMITGREIIAGALRDPNILSLPTFRGLDYPVEEVIRTLSATVGRNVDIISVRAESPYPEDAAQVVNAVVHAYVRWHEANRQLGTSDLLRDLNAQLTRRYQELRTKRKERMMFEQRNPEVVESTHGGVISTTLELLREDLANARVAAMQVESYYQGLQRFADDPETLRQYVYSHRTAGTVPGEAEERSLLEEELLHTRLQLQELTDNEDATVKLSLRKTLENREQSYRKRIEQLDAGFAKEQMAIAKTRAEDARKREEQLAQMYEQEFAKVQGLSGQDSEYTFIVAECEMLEGLCDSLLSQINALDLSARLEGLNIHVLEPALPAIEPFSPKPVTTMAMGGVLGLLAGVGLAFVRDWRDERVRSADEITTLLGVRVLGVVPSISKGSAAARGQRLHLAPQTRESEAFRAIRTALCFGTPRDAKLTILVTSPSHAEGKTTLVSNLGIAMAKAGKKTVIVDSDLRKPMQHRVFSTNGSDAGLADALTGAATCDEVIRHTEVEGLDIIPAGSSTQNPSELLTSESLVRILSRLKARYDLVLVDSPPVGEVADAQILAAYCNLTLLVLRAEHSKRIPTQRARDALLSVRATLAGVVVNGVSKRNCRYNHYDWHVPPYYEYHSDDSHGGRLPADTDQPLDSTAWYRDLHEAARETRRRVSEKGKTQTDTNR